MRYVATLNSANVVINICVVDDDYAPEINETEYTSANPAYIGGDYVDGLFYEPQPFPSWVRQDGHWIAPVPYPTDGKDYVWDEESGSWVNPFA